MYRQKLLLKLGVLEAIWLEHTRAFIEISRQHRVNVVYNEDQIFIKGIERVDCIAAQQDIEHKVSFEFKMELLEYTSEAEIQPYKILFNNEAYQEFCKQQPGLWIFNRSSLQRVLQKMYEKHRYTAQLPKLPLHCIVMWIPDKNCPEIKQYIQELVGQNFNNQYVNFNQQPHNYQQVFNQQPPPAPKKFLNVTAQEAILLFLLLDYERIEKEFQVSLSFIQKMDQIIVMINGNVLASNLEKPTKILLQTLNTKIFGQYYHLDMTISAKQLLECEEQLSRQLQSDIILYSYDEIINKACALEEKFKIQILNQLNQSEEDYYSTFYIGPSNKKVKINDLLTQLIRQNYCQQQVEDNEACSLEKYLGGVKENRNQQLSCSIGEQLNLSQICKQSKSNSLSQQPEEQPNNTISSDATKEQLQYQENQLQQHFREIENSSKDHSDSLMSQNNQINSSETSKSDTIQKDRQSQKNVNLEEEKMQQLIQINQLTPQLIRQIIQLGLKSYQIQYESSDPGFLFCDWQQSFKKYSTINKIMVEAEVRFTNASILIEVKENYKSVISAMDAFFIAAQHYLIQIGQQSKRFIDNLFDRYQIEKKLTNHSAVGELSKKEYDQIEIDEKGQYYAVKIWNYLNYDENIHKSIIELVTLHTSQDSLIIEHSIIQNKIVKILSQEQFEFLQNNFNELECYKLSKYCSQLMTNFYYVQVQNISILKEQKNQLIDIGKELINKFIQQKKQKYKNSRRIQIQSNFWKLLFYSNIQEFYSNWMIDQLEQTFNLQEYQLLGQKGSFTEVTINLGHFRIQSDADLKNLDDTIFSNQQYQCHILTKISSLRLGNHLTLIVRNEALPIYNVTQLDPTNSLIRGYIEINSTID